MHAWSLVLITSAGVVSEAAGAPAIAPAKSKPIAVGLSPHIHSFAFA